MTVCVFSDKALLDYTDVSHGEEESRKKGSHTNSMVSSDTSCYFGANVVYKAINVLYLIQHIFVQKVKAVKTEFQWHIT